MCLTPAQRRLRCSIADRGPIEAPIRSEIFGVARFEQHGRSLAAVHEAKADASSTEFFPRLQENIAVLREAHRYIGLQARTRGRRSRR